MRSVIINAGLERLTRRLERFGALGPEERVALATLLTGDRAFAPREDIIAERRAGDTLYLIVEGFACRSRLLPDGRRQILGLLLPGDLCDLRLLLLGRIDHSISALNMVRASLLPLAPLHAALEQHPRLARALWCDTAAEGAIAHEWMMNVGFRTAFERVAHLLCEVYWRLEAVGLASDNHCRLPLTQTELGDAVALSAVHINRTLMSMRRSGLVSLQGGTLVLHDRKALQNAAGFDPGYLYLPTESTRVLEPLLSAHPLHGKENIGGTRNAGY